jgi:hypothetical protein
MPNPFTTESRDARISLGLDGFMDKLRAPESLHRLVMIAKPANMPNSDYALKSMLDAYLLACIVRGDYSQVQRTLGTLFGHLSPAGDEAAHTVGTAR